VNSVFSLANIITEFKYSIRLAVPLIASEVIYGLNSFAATAMVARLGKEQLAANALVWEIYVAMILFFIGIFCAVGILVAQSFGAKDNNGISISFKQGLIMAFIFTPLMMASMWFAPEILIWTKQDPIVIDLAKPFFYSLAWSMLPLNIMVVMQQFLVSINRIRMVVITSVLAVPIEVFFYYTFLFGKFGFPKTGLAGIGYGLAISYFLIIAYTFFYLYFSKHLKIYNLFHRWWVINRKFLFELIRVGTPLGFMFCVEVTLFAAVAIMMGRLSTTALAAYQITHQYLMIALVMIFALMQSTSVRVGNEVGRNNRNALKLTALVNLSIGLSLMLLFSIFYIGFPHLAISFDIDIHAPHLQELVKEASTFLAIIGVLLLTDCLRIVSAGALRGIKDTKFALFISIVGFWFITFPMAYLLAFKFKFDGAGILWGLVIGLFITGVILFIRFNRLIRRIDLMTLITKAE
jgi:multidrug resistance protein, MATE family